MGTLSLITPPTTEPISLEDAKAHCRIDLTDEDALIEGYIEAARHHVENVTGRQLLTATWELRLDGWSCCIDVPRAPLQSVTVQYVDTAGATQTLATNQYRVTNPAGPTAARGRIDREYAVSWPVLRSVSNVVVVRFVAGYGATGASVPRPLRQAMLLMIAHWYRNREQSVIGTIVEELPLAVDALLGPYRTWALQD